jgi:hypothetical protein
LVRRIIRTLNSLCGRNRTVRLDRVKCGLVDERHVDWAGSDLDVDTIAATGLDLGIAFYLSLAMFVGTNKEMRMRISNALYGEMSGEVRQERLRQQQIAKRPDVAAAMIKSVVLEDGSADVREVLAKFTRGPKRSNVFRSKRRRQKFVSEVLRRLLDPERLQGRRPIIACGNATFCPSYRGYRTVAAKDLLKALSERCLVVMMDEYRTSKECSEKVLSSLTAAYDYDTLRNLAVNDLKFGSFEKLGKSGITRRVNYRRQHSDHGAGITWDRDNNSSRLMAIRLLYLIHSKGHVPPSLDRGFVEFIRQLDKFNHTILDDAALVLHQEQATSVPPMDFVQDDGSSKGK